MCEWVPSTVVRGGGGGDHSQRSRHRTVHGCSWRLQPGLAEGEAGLPGSAHPSPPAHLGMKGAQGCGEAEEGAERVGEAVWVAVRGWGRRGGAGGRRGICRYCGEQCSHADWHASHRFVCAELAAERCVRKASAAASAGEAQ